MKKIDPKSYRWRWQSAAFLAVTFTINVFTMGPDSGLFLFRCILALAAFVTFAVFLALDVEYRTVFIFCPQCGDRLRNVPEGRYRCPKCKAPFKVDDRGKTVLLTNHKQSSAGDSATRVAPKK